MLFIKRFTLIILHKITVDLRLRKTKLITLISLDTVDQSNETSIYCNWELLSTEIFENNQFRRLQWQLRLHEFA